MIESISITNYLDKTTDIELGSPEKSGFAILDITGLGPGKADVNVTDMGVMDGGIYNSSRLKYRNIVIKLRFVPNENNTIEDIRQKSYEIFKIKKMLKLTVTSTNRRLEIYGYVETNDPTIFSKEEGTQISIICPNPYFSSVYNTETVLKGIESTFEFPFSNESLTESTIVMSNMMNNTDRVISYQGDSDIGLFIDITLNGRINNNIKLTNYNIGKQLTISTERIESIIKGELLYGDRIVISTIQGSKYISLIRGDTEINILHSLMPDSDWIYLTRGFNLIAVDAGDDSNNIKDLIIYSKTLYEGV